MKLVRIQIIFAGRSSDFKNQIIFVNEGVN
jgi:hypothetical protein